MKVGRKKIENRVMLQVRIDGDKKELLDKLAKLDNRTTGNYCEMVLLKNIKENYSLLDDLNNNSSNM